MPRSEAQKKADAKYKAKTYRSFTVNMKIDDYSKLEKFCNENDISKAAVISEGCKMYMERLSAEKKDK